MSQFYTNKKNGRLYEKLSEVVDCTNERDGTRAIVYCLAGAGIPQWVREAGEFEENFEPWTPSSAKPPHG